MAAIVKQDQVQLWSEQTSSSVSVSAPSPSEQSHSPPANESSLSLTEKEKSPTPEKEDEENVVCVIANNNLLLKMSPFCLPFFEVQLEL